MFGREAVRRAVQFQLWGEAGRIGGMAFSAPLLLTFGFGELAVALARPTCASITATGRDGDSASLQPQNLG